MYIDRAMRESLFLTISRENELLISHQEQSAMPLEFFQKCMEADEDKNLPCFILEFLECPIKFEEDVTILNILNALSPWSDIISHLIQRNIDNYIKYLSKDMRQNSEKDEWRKIEFVKGLTVNKLYKSSLSFEEMIKRVNAGERGLSKLKNYTGYCGAADNHYNNIYFEKEGIIKSFTGDPSIDVLSYKNVPIVLSEEMKISSQLFDTKSEAVLEEKRAWDNKIIKSVKGQSEFTLYDILKNIAVLLYFESPLTQEEQSENYADFSQNFKRIQKKLEDEDGFAVSEGAEEDSDLMPPNRYMWKEMLKIYEELKAK